MIPDPDRPAGADDGFGSPLVILHELPAIVWEADGEQFQVTYVSESASRILGHDPAAWVSEPGFWERHLHPDDRATAVAQSDAAIASYSAVDLVYRFEAADGSYRWFRDSVRVQMAPGGRPRLTGVMLDITDQQTAETARDLLAVERDRLLQAIELSGEGIVFTDERGRLLYANAAFERLSGATRRQQLGRFVALWAAPDVDSGQPVFEAAADVAQWTGAIELVRHDLGPVRLAVTIARVADDHGRTVGFTGIHRLLP